MMRHLGSDELIDLAEGTRAREDAPHLDACEVCVRRLAAITSAMSSVAASGASVVDIPEPSPLFWDHLSARVREAVDAEGAPPRRSLVGAIGEAWSGSLAYVLTGGVVMAVLVVVMIVMRGVNPVVPAGSNVAAVVEPAAAEIPSDDPSLVLVADLTADMDWETARDAGLTTDGSAEQAVTHLDEDELRQLQGLLRKELARPGA